MSYKADEWMLARKPGGGWVVLGAPKDSDGNVYRVLWPLPVHAAIVAETRGREAAWQDPEFAGIVGAINSILMGIANVGEYTPEPPFDLAAWVENYEAGGTSVQAS